MIRRTFLESAGLMADGLAASTAALGLMGDHVQGADKDGPTLWQGENDERPNRAPAHPTSCSSA